MYLTRAGHLADLLLSRKSKTFAREMRATVPLAKGTEVLYCFSQSLLDRAGRRDMVKNYGFVCNCELCALPDDLSIALDNKIRQAREAADYLKLFCGREQMNERNMLRAVELLDIYTSIIIRERLFFAYSQFLLPVKVVAILGTQAQLQKVGHAVLQIFRRHLGTCGFGDSDASVSVDALSSWLESTFISFEKHTFLCADSPLHVQMEQTASRIISDLESIP
jgi:hypothetical protein